MLNSYKCSGEKEKTELGTVGGRFAVLNRGGFTSKINNRTKT